ncbi:MAG: PAS domain-containing protein [Gemmataceae bacterium]|nr:PAS domain-containing protein [Gemmataceae bacterium]
MVAYALSNMSRPILLRAAPPRCRLVSGGFIAMNTLPCDPLELARRLFADTTEAFFLLDAESGQILDVNPAALRQLGSARCRAAADDRVPVSRQGHYCAALCAHCAAPAQHILRPCRLSAAPPRWGVGPHSPVSHLASISPAAG